MGIFVLINFFLFPVVFRHVLCQSLLAGLRCQIVDFLALCRGLDGRMTRDSQSIDGRCQNIARR
jgi:hypothetical protein